MKKEALKDNWLSASVRSKADLFSELNALLKGLDRLFNIKNLPMPENEDPITRNFHDVFSIVRDSIFVILNTIEAVMPENKKNVYWFQRFTETKLLGDYGRDRFREEILRQDTVEKCFYLLYDSFINLKGIVNDILRNQDISYMTFMNTGQLISKEIRENKYFNPFKAEINEELDKIRNQKVSSIVMSIDDRRKRKFISVTLLNLFRILRYLRFIGAEDTSPISLNKSILILCLIYSEVSAFRQYVEKVILQEIKDSGIEFLIKAISYQMSIEMKRVYKQELRDVFKRRNNAQFLRGRIENSQGILRNLFEQAVVQIVQYFGPKSEGPEIFESFTTKKQQSLKLRDDIYAFRTLLRKFEETAADKDHRTRLFNSLKHYMLYFESFTFKLLRYDDYEEFAKFFNDMATFEEKDILDERGFEKLLNKVKAFSIFLDTTLRQINNRTELGVVEIDMNRVNQLLNQYI